MARTPRSNERFKYGVCLNDECPECKKKTVHQISMRKDLVCPGCGKELRECPPPSTHSNKLIYIIVIVVVLATIAVLTYFFLPSGRTEPKPPIDTSTVDTPPVDTPPVDTPTVDTPGPKQGPKTGGDGIVREGPNPGGPKTPPIEKPIPNPKGTSGTIILEYGKYTGDLKNGKPDGNGELVYTKSHRIVESKDYEAQAGEMVSGTFRDGKVSTVKWYHSDGTTSMVNR